MVIRARIDAEAALRDAEHVCERIDDAQCDGIECRAVDNGSIVCGVPADIHKERGALAHRAAEVPAVFPEQKRRLLLGVRITRVPKVLSEIEKSGAVKLIGSRPGQYLDPARADSVVFR